MTIEVLPKCRVILEAAESLSDPSMWNPGIEGVNYFCFSSEHHLIENWRLQGHPVLLFTPCIFTSMHIHFPDWHLTALPRLPECKALPNPSGKQGKGKQPQEHFPAAGLANKAFCRASHCQAVTRATKTGWGQIVLSGHRKSAVKGTHRQRCAWKCALEGYWVKNNRLLFEDDWILNVSSWSVLFMLF